MEAITAFCERLDKCRDVGSKPDAPQPILRAMSLQLALALDGLDSAGTLEPPLRRFDVPQMPDAFITLEFLESGQDVTFQSGNTVFSLDLGSGHIAEIKIGEDLFPDRSRSPNEQFYTDQHDFVGLYDAQTQELVRRFSWPRDDTGACTANVAFSENTELIAVSYSYDSTVRVWEVDTGLLIREFCAPNHEASIQFGPNNGTYLFAGTKSGARLFHIGSGLAIYSNRIRQTSAVGYSPDGRTVVADVDGNAVYTIDLSALANAKTRTAAAIVNAINERRDRIRAIADTWCDWQRLTYLCEHF